MNPLQRMRLKRKDERVIIHFDYDCFYASVFEAENPALKAVPLAVQQKQIIVTCNYEARRRGLRKMQLLAEARQVCPDVVVVLGEQLDRFRNASKMLYKYLESFTWNRKIERLGLDEVWMDVTDLIDYNEALLNVNDLSNAFFQLSREDPTVGFPFDASGIAGHEYPEASRRKVVKDASLLEDESSLYNRLKLASHLAQYLRRRLDEEKGYTSTVGISTSKLLSKLVGNVNKPKAQTTLVPPYENRLGFEGDDDSAIWVSNVATFVDSLDIGTIPGIGYKMAHKIRNHILGNTAELDIGLAYSGMLDPLPVRDVRKFADMGPELLEKILGGVGMERGIGGKAWSLINGIDDTEVKEARKLPAQISIEDSYPGGLDTLAQIRRELRILATSLINRMHIDLLEEDEDEPGVFTKKWIAHPKTIRLTSRPRPSLHADGARARGFQRISRSGPLPNFVFDLREGVDVLAEKLVQETLLPMFHRLHLENHGWNLSLMNVCMTNMAEMASEDGYGSGRDIGRMFKRQEAVLKDYKVVDQDVPPDLPTPAASDVFVLAEPSAGDEAIRGFSRGSEDAIIPTQSSVDDEVRWEDDEEEGGSDRCGICGFVLPPFAMAAHERYHSLGEG